MIKLENVGKSYGKQNILEEVNLHFAPGIYLIKGENGSGKSTLIKMITGILYKTEGKLLSEAASYLPDRLSFPGLMGAEEFLMLNLNLKKKEALLLLTEYQIPKRRIGELSKGNLLKLGLCVVLSRKMDLYVLDEPTDGLDDFARKLLMNNLKRLAAEGKTILIATHEEEVFSSLEVRKIAVRKGHVYEL